MDRARPDPTCPYCLETIRHYSFYLPYCGECCMDSDQKAHEERLAREAREGLKYPE